MDFFQHQDIARRKTLLLVLYFVLAVVLIILAVYAVCWTIFVWNATPVNAAFAPRPLPSLWNPDLFFGITVSILAVVIIGTVTKIIALSEGGESVARMLGARPVNVNSSDPDENRLVNVVEEVAIASGTPVPRIFLLEEENTINAFAAGFSTKDAVIGVTRGCMKQLSRDELQGVIAHEFSHILNGDMRLNIRLMGILNGILILGIMGYWVFRSAASGSRSYSSGRKRGGNPLPFILLGLSVMVIGYIGVFFGKLIKSAVSRQREFLADASSVQFTRNPSGIAAALKKIGALSSRIAHPNAEQASHLFFADGLRHSFSSLMATHPPLVERIRRIDPSFDGIFSEHVQQAEFPMDNRIPEHGRASERVAASAFSGSVPHAERIAIDPKMVVQSVGKPRPEHLAYVLELISSLPGDITAAAREPFGARALIYDLLLNQERPAREKQIQHLALQADSAVYNETLKLADSVKSLRPETRLPLVDMALATLRSLSKQQFDVFKANLQYLVEADEKITLFEYVLQRMVIRHLDSAFGGRKTRAVQYYDIAPLIPHAAVVLSTLAYYGCPDPDEAAKAFNQGALQLTRAPLSILSPERCGLQRVDEALNVLGEASPQIKKRVLDAATACITTDGRTTIAEAELLRAIADSLECPIPPFLPGQAA